MKSAIGEGLVAGELDRKIGRAVAIGVGFQHRHVAAGVVAVAQRAALAVEGARPQKAEVVLARLGRVRIDRGQIELVRPDREVGDQIAPADRSARFTRSKHKCVDAGAARQRVDARLAGQDIVGLVADDDVVTRIAGAVDRASARNQRQLLKAVDQRVADRGLNRVDAAIGGKHNRIRRQRRGRLHPARKNPVLQRQDPLTARAVAIENILVAIAIDIDQSLRHPARGDRRHRHRRDHRAAPHHQKLCRNPLRHQVSQPRRLG